MSILTVGLTLVALLIIAEVVLSMKWNGFYCTRGLPIFVRRVESAANLESFPIETLEKASATAAGAPFQFRRLDPDTIAFRERSLGGLMHYAPLMHGLIRKRPEEASVAVLGLVNWWAIGLIVFLVAILGRNIAIIGLYAVGALALLYFIQAVRYLRVAKAIRKSAPIT
jgi:hypothetical protein